MRGRAWTGTFLVATVALAACRGEEAATPSAGTTATETITSTSTSNTETVDEGIPHPDGTIDWAPCTEDGLDGGDCATLAVPVDYDDPGGPTLDLALFRRQATQRRVGVLFVNPGGPGGSGVQFASDWRDIFPPNYDLIGFDPRGIHRSGAVDCISDAENDFVLQLPQWPDDDEIDDLLAMNEAQVAKCLTSDLIEHVGTVDVARDMDQIRIALGEEQINYGGFSYGGRLGWTYATLFPDRVRAMMLDAPEDPTADVATVILRQALGMQDQLEKFVEFCTTDPDAICPDDPEAAILEVITRAEQSPIATTIPNPPLSGSLAMAGIQAAFFTPGWWPDLGIALVKALAGNGDALIELGRFVTGRQPDGTYDDPGESRGYVWCKDHEERPTVADFQAIAAEVSEVFTAFGPYPYPIPYCYAVPPTDEPTPLPSEDVPPVVVVGSTGDFATPLVGVEHAAELLGDAVLITRDGDGHTSYGRNTCVTTYVNAFWRDLRLPPEGLVCEDAQS